MCKPEPTTGPSWIAEFFTVGLTALVVMLFRFVTGRVMFRELGPWDSGFVRWAPPVPPTVRAMPRVTYPRTGWARRPGWHRATARLTTAALVLGALVAPLLTVLVVAGVGTAVAAWALWRLRRAGLIDRAAQERAAAEATAAYYGPPGYGWAPISAAEPWGPELGSYGWEPLHAVDPRRTPEGVHAVPLHVTATRMDKDFNDRGSEWR